MLVGRRRRRAGPASVEVDPASRPVRSRSSAYASADCIRTPSTSSLSSPGSSTSSLSNCDIGNSSRLRSTGVRSRSPELPISTPHGCSAMCRGSPSSRSASRNTGRAAASPSRCRAARAGRQRGGDLPGPDVRERLGDGVDLVRRQAHGGADVPDRAAGPVGLHHGHAGDPLLAVPVEDRAVAVEPARRLHVDVDVGQPVRPSRQEALHEQAVFERVHLADADQVVDQAARPRAADRAADAHPPDHVGDAGDGDEVAGQPLALDDVQLGAEAVRWPRAERSRPRAGQPVLARGGAAAAPGRGRPPAGAGRGSLRSAGAARPGRARTGRPAARGRAAGGRPGPRRRRRSWRPPATSPCRP